MQSDNSARVHRVSQTNIHKMWIPDECFFSTNMYLVKSVLTTLICHCITHNTFSGMQMEATDRTLLLGIVIKPRLIDEYNFIEQLLL